MVVLNLLGAIPLVFLNIPPPPRGPRGRRHGRPWREILAERRVVVAMLCGMVAFSLMNLVMASTSLAMIHHGFGTDAAAGVVRVHALAMYAPSFISGPLIARYRSPRIIALGPVLLASGALVALSGTALANFNLALALIGIGWNFGFIGATTMLAGAHPPEERPRVQGAERLPGDGDGDAGFGQFRRTDGAAGPAGGQPGGHSPAGAGIGRAGLAGIERARNSRLTVGYWSSTCSPVTLPKLPRSCCRMVN